jgi:hypothetical protein
VAGENCLLPLKLSKWAFCALSLSRAEFAPRQAQRVWCHAVRYMGIVSYTSTLPPDLRTGHPFAFAVASERDSALMIE